VEELTFYGNLISYCIVIPFFDFINLGILHSMVLVPLAGWGFGPVMHAFKVFWIQLELGGKKIQEILNKDNETKHGNSHGK
jgi:hypothetical protein